MVSGIAVNDRLVNEEIGIKSANANLESRGLFKERDRVVAEGKTILSGSAAEE